MVTDAELKPSDAALIKHSIPIFPHMGQVSVSTLNLKCYLNFLVKNHIIFL